MIVRRFCTVIRIGRSVVIVTAVVIPIVVVIIAVVIPVVVGHFTRWIGHRFVRMLEFIWHR
ncbi:hypothetical protein GCM10009691_26590 [Brevibacterium picturae]|uniref:Uncharacterized protein n=1 Tax=Brevibacterium picturae TaxID=260553 RepID=A0ABN2C129_9MICO